MRVGYTAGLQVIAVVQGASEGGLDVADGFFLRCVSSETFQSANRSANLEFLSRLKALGCLKGYSSAPMLVIAQGCPG